MTVDNSGAAKDRPARLHFLDGIRGWGALVVLFYHNFVLVFFPDPAVPNVLWHLVFFNGTLAVFIFFLVSGYSLAIGFFSSGLRSLLIRLAAGRYVRLAVPILVASLAVYAAFQLDWVAPVNQRPLDLQQALHSAPTLLQTFRFATVDVFLKYRLETSPIPPLWTMPYELGASFLILGLLAFFGLSRFFLAIFFLISVFVVRRQVFFAPFLIGVLLARFQQDLRWTVFFKKVAPFFFFGGLLIGYRLRDASLLAYNACALILFISFAYWSPLRSFVENRLSLYLGRISFPLYLVHSPMFYTASMALLKVFKNEGVGQKTALACVSFINIPMAIALAELFSPVDSFSIFLARKTGHVISNAVDRINWIHLWTHRQKPRNRLHSVGENL